MWYTAEQIGLTSPEIESIIEYLWEEEKRGATESCPDCSASPGELHEFGCDIDICPICHHQVMGCEHKIPQKWDGLWPGTAQCRELKLICSAALEKSTNPKRWTFDYNTLAKINHEKNHSNG